MTSNPVLETILECMRWHEGDKWRYSTVPHERQAWEKHQRRLNEAHDALLVADEPTSPHDLDETGRTGVFTNCGYHGTASGWIVRDGTFWSATFRSNIEANQYVALRTAVPPSDHLLEAERRGYLGHAGHCLAGGDPAGECCCGYSEWRRQLTKSGSEP